MSDRRDIDTRRAQYALRNRTPSEIDRMHREGQAKREESIRRAEDNRIKAKMQESIAKAQFEIEHQRVKYNLS